MARVSTHTCTSTEWMDMHTHSTHMFTVQNVHSKYCEHVYAFMFAIYRVCLREQRVSVCMGVQARTAVPPNVCNTIIVPSQKKPLPEFYLRQDSSGALSNNIPSPLSPSHTHSRLPAQT